MIWNEKLFFDVFYFLPLALQVLFPQADLVVAAADGQYVPTQAPAHSPQHTIEFKSLT